MKLVIFDLDDTLVNFAATRKAAHVCLARFLDAEGVDSAAYLRAVMQVDRPLFQRFEQGQLTRAQYRLQRFAEPFSLIGLQPRDGLVEALNKIFMDCVNDTPLLFDDVLPVLQRLRDERIRTAILTNGPSDGQRRKLKATGLGEHVDHVAIGEEIGVSKPLAQAYHSVAKRFAVARGDALMVGDSPELDYDGALAAGLRAVLLDRDDVYGDGERHRILTLEGVWPR